MNKKSFCYGQIEDMNDSAYEAEFWDRASDQEKFDYAWSLVETALELQNRDKNELRLQRSVGSLQRFPS